MMTLNQRAALICDEARERADELRIAFRSCESGATIIDCGIDSPGGLAAGRVLACVCMAGLGEVQLTASSEFAGASLSVEVATDHPIAACMASQYAGWQVSVEGFFAMGSGPMRAAAGNEELYSHIGYLEKQPDAAVGVLETRQLPTPEVCQYIAAKCRVDIKRVYLLVAPTASIAGNLQVVARSAETALHKLHEIGFPLSAIQSVSGSAPLPPVAAKDLAGIGRTNDAVLYGGRVCLWVACEDDVIEELGPRVPSSASGDFGRPFAEIFGHYKHDFYKIDPHLFSPAMVTFNNLKSGRALTFGQIRPDLLEKSFLEG